MEDLDLSDSMRTVFAGVLLCDKEDFDGLAHLIGGSKETWPQLVISLYATLLAVVTQYAERIDTEPRELMQAFIQSVTR